MASFFSSFARSQVAALTMTIIPVIIFYFCAQKHIIKGIMAGAVKG